METLKYNAIVCKSIDYKDSDKLVSLYTLERGKLFALLKGVKKAGAKLRFAGEPFCFGEFMISGKGSGESAYNTITGCTVIEFFFDISSDLDKFYAGSAVLEILDIAGLFDESNKSLFFESLTALKNIAFSKLNKEVILLHFLLHTLKISGYKEHPETMSPAMRNALRLISEQPDESLGNINISENILSNAICAVGNYFADQFGRKLKSLEIFKK